MYIYVCAQFSFHVLFVGFVLGPGIPELLLVGLAVLEVRGGRWWTGGASWVRRVVGRTLVLLGGWSGDREWMGGLLENWLAGTPC